MRRRILVTIVAVAAFAVTAFFVPAALAVRSRIQRGDLLELQREASIVASRIPATGPIDVDVVLDAVAPGHDVAFYDAAGTLLVGSGPATPDEFVRTALGGTFAEGYLDGDLVAAVPVRPGPTGPALVVRIHEPREESRERLVGSIALLGVAAVAVIAAAAVAGFLLARRLTRPVDDLRRWATGLGEEADRPPPEPTGMSELDDLGTAMAGADERIQELLRRERSFSSHVSHQLRTPVAAMRIAIEAELDAPRADHTEVLHESLGALDRLESTITSMLALARHDSREPRWCDVHELVTSQVEHWTTAYAGAGRPLTTDGAPARALIDPAAVRHVLDVLLDNALLHGRGEVVVRTRAVGEHVEVDVADEGPPPVDADPFSERRADTGHGIGLRLARTLAESEGGHLGLVAGETTRFRLTLPAPSDARVAGSSTDDHRPIT